MRPILRRFGKGVIGKEAYSRSNTGRTTNSLLVETVKDIPPAAGINERHCLTGEEDKLLEIKGLDPSNFENRTRGSRLMENTLMNRLKTIEKDHLVRSTEGSSS